LRTLLYGVLAIAGTLGVVFVLAKALSLDEAIMGHVAFALIFIIAVMWTHARCTQKPAAVNSDQTSM
jgi:hypothetical protein